MKLLKKIKSLISKPKKTNPSTIRENNIVFISSSPRVLFAVLEDLDSKYTNSSVIIRLDTGDFCVVLEYKGGNN